jgi:ferredoxin--NADP+ reductase
MMRACSELTRPYGVSTTVSLNAIMVDGTGMCGGCRVSVGGKTMYACVDGPEFDGHEVDFQLLMDRLTTYRVFEQEANARREACKIPALAATSAREGGAVAPGASR